MSPSASLLFVFVAALSTAAQVEIPASEILSPGVEGFTDLELESEVFGNLRMVRVLVPPGYDGPKNAEREYPVFYFTDGIAAFDARGWGVPEVVGSLLAAGEIEPWIVVAIDNGGSTLLPESTRPVADRASEYLPFEDEDWTSFPTPEPRGVDFPAFFVDEVMPLVAEHFRVRTGPENTGLAGDSYAGLAALYLASESPGVVGRLLLQSPSLQVGDGRILERARALEEWPARVYLACGTREGATPEIQDEMVARVEELAAIAEERAPESRVETSVSPGAEHSFPAFRRALPDALRFLLGRE